MQKLLRHNERLGALLCAACASLVVAFAFSTKWPLFLVGQELLFVKAEDLILLALLICFMFQRTRARRTPLDVPVLVFMGTVALACVVGTLRGTLFNPWAGTFYFIKLAQYIMCCYLTVYLTRHSANATIYIRALIYTAVALSVYGFVEFLFPHPSKPYSYYRVFDRGYFYRDANHIAALLLFAGSVAMGLALWAKTWRSRILFGAAACIVCTALMLTYSRAAYVGIAVAAVTLAFARAGWRAVPVVLLVGAMGVALGPADVIDRMHSYIDLFMGTESSMNYRWQQITRAWGTIVDYPLFGIGLGGRHRMFYENFYLMLLAETGLVGLCAFAWLVSRLYKCAFSLQRNASDALTRGFAFGYAAGLTALLIQANAVVVFVVSRVAGPFWLATAALLLLMERENHHTPDQESNCRY